AVCRAFRNTVANQRRADQGRLIGQAEIALRRSTRAGPSTTSVVPLGSRRVALEPVGTVTDNSSTPSTISHRTRMVPLGLSCVPSAQSTAGGGTGATVNARHATEPASWRSPTVWVWRKRTTAPLL